MGQRATFGILRGMAPLNLPMAEVRFGGLGGIIFDPFDRVGFLVLKL